MSILSGRRHGTRSRYVKGCRCDLCREANAQYSVRQRWAQRGIAVEWPVADTRRITPEEYRKLRDVAERQNVT